MPSPKKYAEMRKKAIALHNSKLGILSIAVRLGVDVRIVRQWVKLPENSAPGVDPGQKFSYHAWDNG